MLKEADSYQGGDETGAGDVDSEAGGKVKDADALFSRLKRLVKSDFNSKGQVNWRREAREDFDFDALFALSPTSTAALKEPELAPVVDIVL